MPKTLSIDALTEEDYDRIASVFLPYWLVGDVVYLDGDLGMGKSALARDIIRSACQNPTLDVPSPTFTLVQHYETKTQNCPSIQHYDLYRLEDPQEVLELGIDEAAESSLVLIEWPDNGGDYLIEPTLTIQFESQDDGRTRRLKIQGDSRLIDPLLEWNQNR